ncbi:MAG: hypothetical protein RMJ98_17960 [Myxococcales bacterium]|nr:hypothetical protein [Polyangiaceae bacterium]MDW8251183.1 hypothetical protein [Myxococcales bacterium]
MASSSFSSLRNRLLLVVAPVVLSACSSSPAPGPSATPTTTPTSSNSAAVTPRPPPVEAEGRPLFIEDQQVKAPLVSGTIWG